MGMETLRLAAAACSWIDPDTGLPEVDVKKVLWDSVTRSFLTGNNGYRFCNFAEITVQADFNRRVVSDLKPTPASKMYRGPSFAQIPSHAFPIKQETLPEQDAVRFTQVVGARTVSPEAIGGGVGASAGGAIGAWGGAKLGAAIGTLAGPEGTLIGAGVGAIAGGIAGLVVGETAGHQIMAFPPIWSKIQFRIFFDGRTQVQLLQHSLFPSLTFYTLNTASSAGDFVRVNQPDGRPFYNATKQIQEPAWRSHGWGGLQQTSTPGPTGGNPWGLQKGITGGIDANTPTPVN